MALSLVSGQEYKGVSSQTGGVDATPTRIAQQRMEGPVSQKISLHLGNFGSEIRNWTAWRHELQCNKTKSSLILGVFSCNRSLTYVLGGKSKRSETKHKVD